MNRDMTFDEELEMWRTRMDRIRRNGIGDSDPKYVIEKLADALWFLLAVAHPPVPGVVEIGGSSPAHQYEPEPGHRTLTPLEAATLNERERCAQVARAAAAKYPGTAQAIVAADIADEILEGGKT